MRASRFRFMGIFKFVHRDLGRGHRGSIDAGDCQVRALALAAGICYDAAWRMLFEAQGRHKACAFVLHRLLDVEPATFGVLRRLPFPARAGQRRMTPRAFANLHPRGSFVLGLAHHLAAMEDGVLYDRWDCSERCVYTAWEIDPAAFKEQRS